MEVFCFNKKLWNICGLLLSPRAHFLDIFCSVVVNVLTIASMIGFIGFSIEYLINERHRAAIDDLLYSLLQVVTGLSAFGPYITISARKQNTYHVCKTVQTTVNKRLMNHCSSDNYFKAERLSYLVGKWPGIVAVLLYTCLAIFAMLGFLAYDLIRGEIDTTQWYNMHKMNPPFDTTTLSGEIAFVFMQIQFMVFFFASYSSCLSMFLGTQFYMEAFCVDLSTNYGKIDQIVEHEEGYQLRKQRMATLLIDSIVFHAKINKLFDQISALVSGILFFQLLCGAAYMATAIIQVDLAFGNFDIKFLMCCSIIVLSVSTVLPFCYYATITITNIQSIGHFAFHSAWYELPTNLQRTIILTIASAQRNRKLTGFGLIVCSRESFVKILQAAISYYLMIKQLSGL